MYSRHKTIIVKTMPIAIVAITPGYCHEHILQLLPPHLAHLLHLVDQVPQENIFITQVFLLLFYPVPILSIISLKISKNSTFLGIFFLPLSVHIILVLLHLLPVGLLEPPLSGVLPLVVDIVEFWSVIRLQQGVQSGEF